MFENEMAVLTSREIEQLVELRIQLEDAHRAVRAAGTYRRAPAVVALDAVVERAGALVTVTRGLSLPRDGKLDDLISRLRQDMGDSWAPSVLPDIKQLRRARNAAQHEGLPPDRELLQGWATAVQVFVTSLVGAQFGVNVLRVSRADAIRNRDWQDMFRQAEDLAEKGELVESGGATKALFDAATSRWMSLRRRRRHYYRSSQTEELLRGLVDEMRSELPAYDDWAFATDPAEAQWTRDALEHDLTLLDKDEVHRALAFVFGWVTAFEVTTQDWPESRSYRKQVRERLTAEGAEQASVESLKSLRRADGDVVELTFRLKNVPSEDLYTDWRRALSERLQGERRWTVFENGTVSVSVDVTNTMNARRATEELHATLQEAIVGVAISPVRELSEFDVGSPEQVARVTAYQAQIEELQAKFPVWLTEVTYNVAFNKEVVTLGLTGLHGIAFSDEGEQGIYGVRALLLAHPHVQACYGISSQWGALAIQPMLEPDALLAILAEVDLVVGPAYRVGQERKLEKSRQDEAMRTVISRTLKELGNS